VVVCGRYELQGDPLRGGFGQVWRANDRRTGERVAVKRVPAADADERRAIRRELVALRHARLPGVVRLRDDAFDEDGVWIVMDFIDGSPFPGRAPDGGWTWEAVQKPTRGLLEALARLHAAGLQHRDLKPANVLVRDDGGVILLDLGLAAGPDLRISGNSGQEGTVAYAAPEQRRAEPDAPVGDGRSDLFSVGVMLYEALAGRRPWVFKSAREAWMKLVVAPVDPEFPPVDSLAAQVPADAAALIHRLLAPTPDDRPPDALAALGALGAGESLSLPAEVAGLPARATAAELAALFDGPDRFTHLAEDAADVLWARTGGRRAAVTAELDAWLRAGRATRAERGLRVTREAVQRLQAGERLRVDRPRDPSLDEDAAGLLAALRAGRPSGLAGARRAAAEAALEAADVAWRLPDGALATDVVAEVRGALSGRASDRLPPLGADGRARIGALMRAGEAERAWTLAHVAASAAMDAGDAEAEAAALAELTLCALVLQEEEAAERTLRVLEDVDLLSGPREGWCGLIRAQRAALGQRDVSRAAEVLAQVGELADDRLEVWRWALELPMWLARGPDEAEAWLATLEARCAGDPAREGKRLGWLGVVRYRQNRFVEAAALHQRSAALKEREDEKLASSLNAASALLEAGALDEAARVAAEAASRAASLRLARYEALTTGVVRAAAYRAGRAGEAQFALVEGAAAVDPGIASHLGMNEGAVAWRAGDAAALRRTLAVALPAARASQHLSGLLVRALQATVDGDAGEVIAECAVGRVPAVVAQALALVDFAADDPAWQRLAAAHLARVTPDPRRSDVLSGVEVVERLSAGLRRAGGAG
jgi:hypothetical protein